MEPAPNSATPGTEILSEEACWARLRRTSIGRIGVIHDDQPAVYPVNYLVDGSSVVFRTRPESKISQAPLLERVAFEIDGFEPEHGDAWSVLIKGFGRSLDSVPEIAQVDELPLFPWVDVDRSAWVRVIPVEVTGRSFHLNEGIAPDASIGWSDAVTPRGPAEGDDG